LKHPEYEVTALVRDQSKAAKLEEFGSKTLIGGLDDFELLKNAAANTDVVIHTADSSDHVPSAKAIIAGLKIRDSNGPNHPIYIHTSGTGSFLLSSYLRFFRHSLRFCEWPIQLKKTFSG
jgi:putative NADH-flavin reductase